MRENDLGNDTDANTSGDSNLEGIVGGSNGGGDDENDGMDSDGDEQWSDALYRFEVSNALNIMGFVSLMHYSPHYNALSVMHYPECLKRVSCRHCDCKLSCCYRHTTLARSFQ
jgi:hypothetical protein